jgi:hypothetical protein
MYPPEYTVVGRNESGATVDVRIGYSLEFVCDASLDGSQTEARYLVSADRVTLVSVEIDAERPDESVCE